MALAGIRPDPWQAECLASDALRSLWLCSRQTGKSTLAAALALRTAILDAPALVLIVAPTLRQSGELFRKVRGLYSALMTGRPEPSPHFAPVPVRKLYHDQQDMGSEALVQESALQLTMRNGSRIVSLPGKEASVRSYSAPKLLVIDEAARCPDELYFALRPMLATSGGRLVALSSAWAKVGWMWEAWAGRGEWAKVMVTAPECPRIPTAFLRDELEALGPRWYAMEYLCEFGDAIDALFTEEDVRAMMDPNVKPLFTNLFE